MFDYKKYPLSLKATKALIGIAIILIIIHLSLQALYFLVFKQHNLFIFELSNRFDFDDEASVPTWFNAILLFCLSCLCWFNYRFNKHTVNKAWFVLGLISLLLSIDEIAGFHENLLQFVHIEAFGWDSSSIAINSWWLLSPFILVASFLIYKYILKQLGKECMKLFVIAGVIYLSGSVIVEGLTSTFVASGASFITSGLFTAIEESMEILGVIIAILAALITIEKDKIITTNKGRLVV